ncbi:hypothetical protein BD560DRAFT_410874 [Blakeslea trispora]|nr:hypothetical protein BD560DRAFT_410874 [Blakeslea trispora]
MHQFLLTFDLYYDEDVRQVACNLPTFLYLPLTTCFKKLSEDHWILQKRHRPLLTSDFFCIDHTRHSFRLLGASDHPRFPRLLSRLDKGLRDCTIRIHPRLREAIELFFEPTDDFSTTALAASLRSSIHWTDHTSNLFTSCLRRNLLQADPSGLSSVLWLRFWSLPLDPSCRTFWFRVLHNKFHCQATIALFRPNVSPACPFCLLPSESRSHLLRIVLRTAFPFLDFSPGHVINVLWKFQTFDYAPPAPLFTLCAATARAIWCAHWAFVRQATPFRESTILKHIYQLK